MIQRGKISILSSTIISDIYNKYMFFSDIKNHFSVQFTKDETKVYCCAMQFCNFDLKNNSIQNNMYYGCHKYL